MRSVCLDACVGFGSLNRFNKSQAFILSTAGMCWFLLVKTRSVSIDSCFIVFEPLFECLNVRTSGGGKKGAANDLCQSNSYQRR